MSNEQIQALIDKYEPQPISPPTCTHCGSEMRICSIDGSRVEFLCKGTPDRIHGESFRTRYVWLADADVAAALRELLHTRMTLSRTEEQLADLRQKLAEAEARERELRRELSAAQNREWELREALVPLASCPLIDQAVESPYGDDYPIYTIGFEGTLWKLLVGHVRRAREVLGLQRAER